MRNLIATFLLILSLTAMVAASPEGDSSVIQILTVRVEAAPPTVAHAQLWLHEDLPPLALERSALGEWVGRYAILPQWLDLVLSPRVTLFDNELAEVRSSEARVEMASSGFEQDTLPPQALQGELIFLYDPALALETIEVRGSDGEVIRLPLSPTASSFRLPLEPHHLSTLRASSGNGRSLVFEPEWTALDIATMEEEL